MHISIDLYDPQALSTAPWRISFGDKEGDSISPFSGDALS